MTTRLSTAAHARYRIIQDHRAGYLRPFKILDELMGGQTCALPDASGHLQELRFVNAKAARNWLAAGSGE